MKIILVDFFLLSCIAVVFCTDVRYVGKNGNTHIYEYNGVQYKVSDQFHNSLLADPQTWQRRFIESVQPMQSPPRGDPQRPSYSGNHRPAASAFNNKQPPTQDELNSSQNINSFQPFREQQQQQQQQHQQQQQQQQRPNPPNRDQQRPNSQNTNIHFPPGGGPPPYVPSFASDQTFDPLTGEQGLPTDTGYDREIPRDRDQSDYRGSLAITDFAWNLFRNSNNQQNYVLSPLSPQILLSYLAWVAEGQTRNELVAINGFGSPNQLQKIVSSMLSDGSGRELQIATAFFVSQDMRLNKQFLDRAVQSADVVNVDFKNSGEASRTIGRWAKSKTKGGLKLTEINYAPSTKIALTSAIYFKGNWVYTFKAATPGYFNTPNGQVTAPMMNMKRKFRWGKIDEIAEWVAIPYESSDSLVIILPNIGQDVDSVMNSMSSRDLDSVLRDIDSESSKANVNITMPKFKIESKTSLIEPLKRMGVNTLFSTKAQLPYLSDYDQVQVTNAQQQASMEVNEEGTVFIAFTNLNVVALSFQAPVPDVEFNVNRPFIAIIADNRRSIPYVMAKITNPLI